MPHKNTITVEIIDFLIFVIYNSPCKFKIIYKYVIIYILLYHKFPYVIYKNLFFLFKIY
jgi:hypothetical protein